MLTQLEKTQEKWGGSQQLIDRWLDQRQQVLVGYCELAGLPPFKRENSALPKTADVKRFCQLLIDYISKGHFEVFGAIEKGSFPVKRTSELLINGINKSTDLALRFNDMYVKLDEATALANLDSDLSKLGPFLEERFELEDGLIALIIEKN